MYSAEPSIFGPSSSYLANRGKAAPVASSEGLIVSQGGPVDQTPSSHPGVLMQVTMAPPLTNAKEGCLLKKMFQENNLQINLLA